MVPVEVHGTGNVGYLNSISAIMGGEQWTADFNETKTMGSVSSTLRTEDQTT